MAKERTMGTHLDKNTVYIPRRRANQKVLERLQRIAEEKDRSL